MSSSGGTTRRWVREPLADGGQANTCTHASATGIDTTPVSDPAKVWRCDHCGLRWSGGVTEDDVWQAGYRNGYDGAANDHGARDDTASAAVVRARALAERWAQGQAEYPPFGGGEYAAAAVRLCAKDLLAALDQEWRP